MKDISIDGRLIGPDHPPYIIAEMSGNHNHDLDRAKLLITKAHEAGADAVKLQTYTADTITIRSDRPEFRVNEGLWEGRQLHDLYEEAHTPWDWHPVLFEHAKKVGITIFSSPFDPTAVEFLMDLGAPAFKVASAEITDFGLIEMMGKTGKPVIMSTGMATNEEILEAVNVLKSTGNENIIVLHCISAYPTPVSGLNLNRMTYLRDTLNVHIGLSDHSMGVMGGICSAVAGAVLLEKHFTLKREDGGVDSAFSLDIDELAELCRTVKEAHSSLGSAESEVTDTEAATRQFRRSLYFVKELKAGETITADAIRSIRPSNGLHPKHLKDVVGKVAAKAIPQGTPASWDDIV